MPASIPTKPTPSQTKVLTLLAGGPQPLREVWQQLGQQTRIESTERLLARLAAYGWLTSLLHPDDQGRPTRYWQLCPAGTAHLEVPSTPTRTLPALTPSTARPTAKQRAILETLNNYAYLTNAQIAEDAANGTADKALQRRLLWLRSAGWIAEQRLYPERGNRSPRYWTLLPAGATALGIAFNPFPPATLATIQADLAPGMAPLPSVSPSERAILALLAEWKALRTGQIWQTLDPTKTREYTKKRLITLAQTDLIQGTPLPQMKEGAQEYYWILRPQGAAILQIPYDKQYRRRPTGTVLDYRGVLLTMLAACTDTGWRVLPPQPAGPAHPAVEYPPQYEQLRQAVLLYEYDQIRAMQERGEPRDYIQTRYALYQAGLVGGVVPTFINDYVAYHPAGPQYSVVLIPHPPGAGSYFWTRHLKPRRKRSNYNPSRAERYRRLAPIVPVIAVFPTADEAREYGRILRGTDIQPLAVDRLKAVLTDLYAGQPNAE